MGIDHVVTRYKDSLKQVQFSGPTFLTQVLTEFRLFVESTVGRKTYPVLLILIDGTIHDSNSARDEIIKLAKLPCSIIVVGVGNSDFQFFEDLSNGFIKNDKEEVA